MEDLSAPINSTADKFQLIPEFLKVRGLVKQQLDSFDYFINVRMKKIVDANCLITSTLDQSVYLRFKHVRVGKASIVNVNVIETINPQMCRLADMTYTAPIYVNIEYVYGNLGKMKTRLQDNVIIGRMPIMLRSCCCVLHGKDEEELARLGECPLDPGGYFVIKGTEKVLLIQEQLSNNRIFIDSDKKGNINASVTSSTEMMNSKTIIQMEKEKIYLFLHQFEIKIPIIIVLKAMGMETDQEVVQMVGRDPRFTAALLPSIQECNSKEVFTQKEALDYLGTKVSKTSYKPPLDGCGAALYILSNVFLAHVPVRDNNFLQKCVYVGVMLRRMIEASFNKDKMDDKDYVGNKQFELSGQLMSLLFEDLFKTMTTEAIKKVDSILRKDRSSRFDFSNCLAQAHISLGLERTLSTGNFDIKRFRLHRKGVTQVLTRLSFIGSLGFMTKISSEFEKSRKDSGHRSLQPSQWGMLCPCDTPTGESCGLVKNLALMTHVTTDEEEKEKGKLVSMCYKLGVIGFEVLSVEELQSPDSFLVILNGILLGIHIRPQLFANSLRKLRRKGKIGEFVSVFVNENQHCVYIASDGGRLCRPLVIADKGVSRVKQHHMKELQDGIRTFNDFVSDGLIEYLDVNEHNNTLIALHESDATTENVEDAEAAKIRADTTHIEIEPFTILGVVAGLIPYPHHSQSLRNTYQCAVGKQAMGNIAYNQLNRMDKELYLLVYPQRPLLTTKTIELVGFDKLGAGQNATVAVMSYGGYDIKDAIVMNKASLDRGFGRCIVMKGIVATNQKYDNDAADRILRPQRTGPDAEKMQILDDDGIAAPGEIIRRNDIYLNRELYVDSQYSPSREYFKGLEGETATVDRVALYTDTENRMCIKYVIRQTRRPEVGDKFSSRHGQKGVCGTIVPQEDFPFSELGICPDLIINPHTFPSRMTVGKMLELLGSKAGVSSGRFHYGTAFGERGGHADNIETISATLISKGFSYSGKEFLYSGISGEPLTAAYILMGPIYYQSLKHMVVDKMRASGSGLRDVITRQPAKRSGSLLVGERERDCLIAYGASMLIYERLMLSSDVVEVQVCRTCGLMGYYNYKLEKAVCTTCKNGDTITSIKLPYACKLLFQELMAMNVVPRLKLGEA